MSRWLVSATFVMCVHDFLCGEVLVKVGIIKFGLYQPLCREMFVTASHKLEQLKVDPRQTNRHKL